MTKADKMPNRIREIRLERGLSQEQLGAMVGTGNQQISKIERGRLRLSEPWMNRIAAALHVRPYELLNNPMGTDDPIELQLLDRFRTLTDEQREYVLHSIAILTGSRGPRGNNGNA